MIAANTVEDAQQKFAEITATLSLRLIAQLGTESCDVGVKIAALRAAADTLTHAVSQQAVSIALYRALNQGK